MPLSSITSSEHFYILLFIAVCLLTAINIFEIVYLLVHMRRLKNAEARKKLLKQRAATAIITTTDPDEVLPKPLYSTDYEAYCEAAASIIESFEGEIAERASRLVHKFRIDVYYKRLARGSVWYKRAHAIDTLSSLKLSKNREFFQAVFRSETSDEVKYRIIYGLSRLVRDQKDIYALSKMLSTLPYLTAKYTEDVFFNVITTLKSAGKEDEFGSFLKNIMADQNIRTRVKRDCLSACNAAGCEKAGSIVKEYYRAFLEEPEIVIACIKTLVSLGDFSVLPAMLRHKDWRVRLTAVKYAHLCNSDIAPDSKKLLHDPEYHFAVLPGVLRHKDWRTRLANLKLAHVHNFEMLEDLKAILHDKNYHLRLNAALALSRLGAQGIGILREESASADKFAAETAKYALGSAETAA